MPELTPDPTLVSDGLPTEAEIIAHWREDQGTPVVSILCPTFRQDIYIRDALDSFFAPAKPLSL